MLEAFYFGKGKPPEASQEDEILQLVWGFGLGFFDLLFVCIFFISTVNFKNAVFFCYSRIFFKIFKVFLSENAKVNVKYFYGQKMVGFQHFHLFCENFMVLCFN